jgi:hypothetical protein
MELITILSRCHRFRDCRDQKATDNDDYRDTQVVLGERELDHISCSPFHVKVRLLPVAP